MSAQHLHQSRRRDRRSLLIAAGLAAGIFVLEVVGGIVSGSLALLADAGHVLTDMLAMLLAYTATVLASRPADPRRTWGYHRLEILSALTNGLFLLFLAALILWEAALRLRTPEPVATGGMLTVAFIGLLANVAGVILLSRGSGSLNVRGALWHVVGDTLSSAGVILAAVAIRLTGITRIDPLVSILIAGVIVYGALRLVREAVDILLESTPRGLDTDAVAAAIGKVDGVAGVHDLHIWSITTGMPALSGHVIAAGGQRVDEILIRVKRLLREKFAIDHTTIQVESECCEEVGALH